MRPLPCSSPHLGRDINGSRCQVRAQFRSELRFVSCHIHQFHLCSSSVTGPAPPHHTCRSPPSRASLPPTSSLSQIADFSPEAMLAEIAKIRRENEAIKAQLSRARDLGPAPGGAPDSEQRGQSASSAGSFTTQTETSGGRNNHQGWATEGQMLLTQVRWSLVTHIILCKISFFSLLDAKIYIFCIQRLLIKSKTVLLHY